MFRNKIIQSRPKAVQQLTNQPTSTNNNNNNGNRNTANTNKSDNVITNTSNDINNNKNSNINIINTPTKPLQTIKTSTISKSFKSPSKLITNNNNNCNNNKSNITNHESRYFTVLYTDRSLKKHKTYSNGVLVIQPPNTIKLYNDEYKEISKSIQKLTQHSYECGCVILTHKHEIEIEHQINKHEFDTGRIFINKCVPQSTINTSIQQSSVSTAMKPVITKQTSTANNKSDNPWYKFGLSAVIYNPNDSNALILNNDRINLQQPHESLECPVIVEPRLTALLRKHQFDGIRFMYQCIAGYNGNNFTGCILADEMYVYKTNQFLPYVD